MAHVHAWIRLADSQHVKADNKVIKQDEQGEQPVDAVSQWQQQYPMPRESAATRAKNAFLYHPPRSDAAGIAIALTVITAWAMVFFHALFQVQLVGPQRSPWWDICATFAALEFLYTGLFITTHDAMHGTIAYRHRKVNDFLGYLAISLYAWFDYGMLKQKHWEHHQHTGEQGADPDFHNGNPGVLPWYLNFMWTYLTLNQLTKISCWATVLHILGAPMENIGVYLTGAAVLASFRLFYFGTYIVHKPTTADEVMCWQKAHTLDNPAWLAFAKCWCFVLHFEHHRWPYAPWWQLPKCHAINKEYAVQEHMLADCSQQEAARDE